MINKLVSIKEPVLNSLEDMGIDSTKDIPVITRWASEAERMIGSYYSYRKKWKTYTLDGCSVELPCDAKTVQGVVLGDFEGECEDIFEKFFLSGQVINANTTDTFMIIDKPDPNQQVQIGGVKWEVQDNNLVFKTKLIKQKITIQYLGLLCDEDGFPKVGENHLIAIVEYIMYKYALRSRFTPNKMDLADVQRFARNWDVLAMDARAVDAEISDSDRQEIIGMISNPWIGYGMELTNRFDLRFSQRWI